MQIIISHSLFYLTVTQKAFVKKSVLSILIFYFINTHFDVAVAIFIKKHFENWSICSFWANAQVSIMFYKVDCYRGIRMQI